MHEPCLYGWKSGAGHYFGDKRNISTVYKSVDVEEMSRDDLLKIVKKIKDNATVMFEKKPIVDDLHPTMKPIRLIINQIKNSSRKGDVVLDLFGGSGTTLLACEELGRRCYMMEFDPKYADVILRRAVENGIAPEDIFVERNGEKLMYADLVKEVETHD